MAVVPATQRTMALQATGSEVYSWRCRTDVPSVDGRECDSNDFWPSNLCPHGKWARGMPKPTKAPEAVKFAPCGEGFPGGLHGILRRVSSSLRWFAKLVIHWFPADRWNLKSPPTPFS